MQPRLMASIYKQAHVGIVLRLDAGHVPIDTRHDIREPVPLEAGAEDIIERLPSLRGTGGHSVSVALPFTQGDVEREIVKHVLSVRFGGRRA
jgi:hypothetical protein